MPSLLGQGSGTLRDPVILASIQSSLPTISTTLSPFPLEMEALKFPKYDSDGSESVKSFSHVQLSVTSWTICSLPCSSVHGVLQAKILEWVAIAFSRGSTPPRDQTWVSALQADSFFTV